MNDPSRNNYPPTAVDYPPPGSVISSGSHGRGPPTGPPGSGQISPPPPQTSITVNTDATPGGQVTEINLNLGYFKTLPGILKLVQLVSSKIHYLSTDVRINALGFPDEFDSKSSDICKFYLNLWS